MKLTKTPFALAAVLMATATALSQQAFGSRTSQGFGGAGIAPAPQRHRGKGQANRRGKGSVNRPKKRPNMRHVSKRVRRKHRRAA